MPPLAVTCIFVACISPLMVPAMNRAGYVDYLSKGCRKAWYLDVFFASNFVQYIKGLDKDFNYSTVSIFVILLILYIIMDQLLTLVYTMSFFVNIKLLFCYKIIITYSRISF